MIIIINEYCFFDKINIGSSGRFLKKFGVKRDSYAGRVAMRVYNQFFGNSVNVLHEYKKFYAKEFTLYKDFLVCRYNISDSLAEELMNIKNLNCKDMSDNMDDIAYTFSYDDELKEMFVEYVGGIVNEN